MRERIIMAVSIMTIADFYTAVASNEITPDVIAKANELIAKHEADLAKAKEKRAEKAKTTDSNVELVASLLTSIPQTCSDLLTALVANGAKRADEKELTPQYVARLMKTLVDSGRASKSEIKVEGAKGKKVAYTLADAE